MTGVAEASDGSILVLNHGENHSDPQTGYLKQIIRKPAVLVIDPKSGKVLGSWGSGTFMLPHQISVDIGGNVWVADAGLKRVFKFDSSGAKLMELGGQSALFNMPTDVLVLPDGNVLVADGAVNRRGFLFSDTGKLLGPWGARSKEPLQYHSPHSLAMDDENRVYIADRENHWVQVLSAEGKWIATWENLGRPATVRFHAGSVYVLSNLPAAKGIVRRLNKDGEVLDVFHTKPRGTTEDFEWPHGLAVTNGGDHIYVGFALTSRRVQRYKRVSASKN